MTNSNLSLNQRSVFSKQNNFPPNFQNAVCVFCGSSEGTQDAYVKAAKSLGAALAKANIPLCYGGGTYGLMGAVASGVLAPSGPGVDPELKGHVWGVIPSAMISVERQAIMDAVECVPKDLRRPVRVDAAGRQAKGERRSVEGSHSIVTVTQSMHERKWIMGAVSQRGFIALPGGYGTLEEVAEMTTWTQLGIHKKPVILLNVLNFYDGLRTFLDSAISSGFIRPENRSLLVFVDPPKDGGEDFDWGQAALDALRKWHSIQGGVGGGVPYSGMTWGDTNIEDRV